jgi:hypothetical protein
MRIGIKSRWKNPASAQNGRAGGRPKVYAAVKIPLVDAAPLLAYLAALPAPPEGHEANTGWAFLVAGIASELAGAKMGLTEEE